MNTKSIIEIFRGDDSDALGYQTIVGTIHTDLDLTGCKAVFRYLGFFQEFDPIPEDKKLTIVIPSASSMQFPPGFGYASLKVYDIDRKVRTFTNRIPMFVKTMTPCIGGGEFDVEFSPFHELAPLKIFKGPNAEDFDLYTGFVSKIIDRASAEKYGLSMLLDAMDADKTAEGGYAASPAAVKAAYDAIIGVLTDNYYTREQTDEAIDKLAAYYITADAQGNPFATKAALVNAQTYYSGGAVRTPTRNDYAVVTADETHGGAEWRYIYAVDAQGVGQWESQYPIETNDYSQLSNKPSINGVTLSGNKSAAGLGLAAQSDATLTERGPNQDGYSAWVCNPSYVEPGEYTSGGVVSIYYANSDWCIKIGDATSQGAPILDEENKKTELNWDASSWNGRVPLKATRTALPGYQLGSQSDKPLASEAEAQALRDGKQDALTSQQLANIAAVTNKLDKSGGTMTGPLEMGTQQLLFGNGRYCIIQFGNSLAILDIYSAIASKIPFSPTGEGTLALAAPTVASAGNLAALDAQGNPTDSQIPAANVALKDNIPYALGTPIAIDTASSETVEGETVYYGEATIANRTANIVQVTAATPLDELRITFPAATSDKVRDFGLRVEIGTGSAALAAPALVPIAHEGETIRIENNAAEIPALADGTATAKGVTLLYFSETAPGVFVVKGEQVEEVA